MPTNQFQFPSLLKTLFTIVTANKAVAILAVVSLYAAFAVGAAVFNLWKLKEEVGQFTFIVIDASKLHTPRKVSYFHILDGDKVENVSQALVMPLGVVIDNVPPVYALEGLEEAKIVIEFPVEGGITRFLAFFDPYIQVAKIGPVRSARPYFLDFADELHALFAHSGGSPAALAMLQNDERGFVDVDEIGTNGRYFWRDRGWSEPHNLFTSVELLEMARAKLAEDAVSRMDYEDISWQFEEVPENFGLGEFDSVTIDYSTTSYEVQYQYEYTVQKYLRYQGGTLQVSNDGERVAADNVLIARMKTKVIDKEGRLDIATIGDGDAVVCRRGLCKEGRWQKESRESRIRFFVTGLDEASGLVTLGEVKLAPGKTWINIVPIGRRVEVKTVAID